MTKAEKEHNKKLVSVGCIVCLKLGHGYSQPEIHHLRNGVGMGQRNGYKKAIPLCHTHHRTGEYGISFHAGKQAFEANFGTELELLQATQECMVVDENFRV